jgi:6-phosphogluconolactonase
VKQLNSWRVTLTIPVLNAAREIIFLAAGKQKSSILQRILNAKETDSKLPASLIHPKGGTLSWMIDEEAGSLLKQHTSRIIERR